MKRKGPLKKDERSKYVKTSITLPPRLYKLAKKRAKHHDSLSAFVAALIRRDAMWGTTHA